MQETFQPASTGRPLQPILQMVRIGASTGASTGIIGFSAVPID